MDLEEIESQTIGRTRKSRFLSLSSSFVGSYFGSITHTDHELTQLGWEDMVMRTVMLFDSAAFSDAQHDIKTHFDKVLRSFSFKHIFGFTSLSQKTH